MKGLRNTSWQLQNWEDVKYSIKNVVDHVIITYGAGCILELLGGSLCTLHNCLASMPLCLKLI